MRIGVDASCWNSQRGYGRFTRGVLNALVEEDQANEYVFFADAQTAASAIFPPRARIVVVNTQEAPAQAASATGRRSLRDLGRMGYKVQGERLAVFFFPTVYTYFPLFNRVPQVLTIHDVIPETFPAQVFANRKLELFWRLKLLAAKSQARLVLTVSRHSQQGLTARLHLPLDRIRVVSEAADSIFRPLDEAGKAASASKLALYGLRVEQPYILYVGGISPHKNLGRLIEAYARLDWNGSLVLVGDYQGDVFYSSYQSLQQQIACLGLEEKVIFTGFVPDEELVYLYNGCQLTVLPSLDEGFGLPALEAAACGVPVLAGRTSSVPEVLGQAGIYFDPCQLDELTETLGQVLNDPQLRQRCREQGLARAESFSWARAAQELKAVLLEAARPGSKEA